MIKMNDAYPIIERLEAVAQLGRFRCRTVVDQEDLKMPIRLVENT